MAYKCKCGKDICHLSVWVESPDGANLIPLMFTDREGKEMRMYLDANTAILLIKDLREAINDLINA
ncbi:Uncharacterized [Moorella glycerini]|uniref:Uncharacterized protein n=1 Tax=Neomoorella stamsii TaxID=1266720 RepID=A0A9X7J1L9_9FIRM|nr:MULTISPECIES: hypothetical protein [Moorella]PRR69622.1 hypothetical protein MOST_30440 [Moorella stamsii]CEP67854.1 Uncharacterized [Moorella glycerini]